MLDISVKSFRGEITNNSVQTIGTLRLFPSFLVGFDTLGTEVEGDHVSYAGKSPFCDILASAAADIKDMQEGTVAFFEVERAFDLSAHGFGLGLYEYSFDPIVEGFQFVCASGLSFEFVVVIFSFFVIVLSDLLV